MLTRRTLAALAAAAVCATPALAQAANPKVLLTTAEGPITIELFVDKAPITAGNFLKYVDQKRFDGASFYRASRPPNATGPADYGVVQGGLQNDPKKVLPPIAHESTKKTGLSHTDGTISMGRRAPGTAQADWFICVGEQTYLDADPKDPKNLGFAAFGRVTDGMDIVRKMLGAPVDPNKGEGTMKGEILKKPVKILTVRRVSAGA